MRRADAFTLIELLMVVLVVGLLASIAVPTYHGQKRSAQNAHAMSSVRVAVDAALAHFHANGATSFGGMSNSVLRQLEPSLSPGAPYAAGPVASPAGAPGTGADPGKMFIGNGVGWGSPAGRVATLCAVSRGDSIYCAAIDKNTDVIRYRRFRDPGNILDMYGSGSTPTYSVAGTGPHDINGTDFS